MCYPVVLLSLSPIHPILLYFHTFTLLSLSLPQITAEISNPPRNYGEVDPDDLTREEMHQISEALILAYQLGEMPEILGLVDVISMSIVEPPLDAYSPEWVIFGKAEVRLRWRTRFCFIKSMTS